MIRKAVVIVPSEEEATNRAKNQTKVDSLEVAEAAMGEMRGRVNNKINNLIRELKPALVLRKQTPAKESGFA